jgi:hypothetical protein
MTLNDLETNKLRKPYADPRLHLRAGVRGPGCPRLRREAYDPAKLDAQLTEQTQRALQHPRFVRVDEAAKKVLVSEIFKWYEADFKATGKSTLAYINQYRGRQPFRPRTPPSGSRRRAFSAWPDCKSACILRASGVMSSIETVHSWTNCSITERLRPT